MHAVGLSCLAALLSAFFLVAWSCLPPVSLVSFCPFLVLEVGVGVFFCFVWSPCLPSLLLFLSFVLSISWSFVLLVAYWLFDLC